MTLKDLNIGETAVVGTVGGEGALRQHFLDMGLIPGESHAGQIPPLMGESMELSIHGYELTLRLDDAARIQGDSAKAPAAKKAEAESEKPVEHRASAKADATTKKGERTSAPTATPPLHWRATRTAARRPLFNQLTGSNQHVGNFQV